MKRTPLEYGKLACEALMHKYEPEKLPPEGVFFYHQGVFLSGMQRVYLLSKEKKYFGYIKSYVDSVIGPMGEVMGFCHEKTPKNPPGLVRWALTTLDHKQPSILLYNLYDETGEKKYENAIHTIAKSMHYWPINSRGGYWHMLTQVYQMWLDGAYMAGPLSTMYAARYGDEVLRERAIQQIFIMDDMMKDKESGLYFHGWDDSVQKQGWADSQTGLSGIIWGRAVGWYAVAILDMLDDIPDGHPSIHRLEQIVHDLLEVLARYQDPETGMWFQVVDKPEKEDNWVESSCTSLFIYSYAKALRKGIIEETYVTVLKRAYAGIVDSLYYDEEGYLVVDNVCIGTCIDEGTYEHYIGREKVKNDLHGAGAFILMCAEMEQWCRSKGVFEVW